MDGTMLLVSTFGALLRVTLGPACRPRDVEVLDDRYGTYYGLTRGPREIFVVARLLPREVTTVNDDLM